MRTPSDLPRRVPRTSRRFRIGVLVVIVLLVILIYSLRGLATFWTDYLWFDEVGYQSVFRGVLVTKVVLAVTFVAIFFVMMAVSLTVADRVAPEVPAPGPEDELVDRYRQIRPKRARILRLGTAVVFALFGGISANSQWNNWDLFRYHVNFPASDPQFHKNIGFYVFQLPFIKFLLNWFFLAFIVVLLVTVVAHYLNGGIRFQSRQQRTTTAVKTHVSLLLGILALIKGVDYYFERLELVLSRQHVVDGATATSVHADLPAKDLLIAIAVIAAGLFLFNIYRRGWTLPIVGVALWGLVWIIVGGIYPAAYQALRVNPSEFTREQPYIQRNITATNDAYGLNHVQVNLNYQANQDLSASEIQADTPQGNANRQAISNVPLLDPDQLSQTFDKLQALRSYYQFLSNGLSSDRYIIGGQLTQVVAAVRELNEQSVPSGFVNTQLTYTHGYGAVVAPASQEGVNADGTPNFSLSQIPPQGTPSLDDQGSQIYYGEAPSDNSFVISHTSTSELDYESVNQKTGQLVQNTNHYTGSGGVPLGNIFRRAAFALRFGDYNLLLSGQLSSSSRVMYYRNIAQRVQKAAPFLKLDSDPYPVILNNQVYWVQDAYTTTNNYPYSQEANTDRVPSNSGLNSSFNYVRNSVKVVVNAYTGKMNFFVVDPSDPIIQVYEKAFPDLFTKKSPDSVIPGISEHFRYPQDIFRVQTNMYGRYHLTDAAAFYSQAQSWAIAQDPGSGLLNQTALATTTIGPNGQTITTTPRLQPEYIVDHAPGSTNLQFEELQPFEPYSTTGKQQNLTAFMTASSNPNTYGQLQVYETPPGANVDGPALVANAIKSNQSISSELTLLSQGSSQVVLGQVQAIPIDQNLLYVQPVYVQSSSNATPTLQDVVVVYNDAQGATAYHSGNASLDAALCKVTNDDGSQPFSSYCNTTAANQSAPGGTTPTGTGTGSGTSSSSTSTTTPSSSSSSTVPAPAAGQTVSSLLAAAANDFQEAQAALKAGNLSGYATDVSQAQTAVSQAQALEGQSSTTTTTVPPPTTATTKPPSTTTTTKPPG